MEEYVLETRNLTKTYQRAHVLHNISVALRPGRIYGLIGKNGAGKSTFMRVAAGLAYPTNGELILFGKTGEKQLLEERKRMGCMIEYPALNQNMTARESMRYHRLMRGIPDPEIEEELLALVGLDGTGRKKGKHFSVGMAQRLGIAIALLGNPELLLLDEPMNGIDPEGVVQVRSLLLKLCREQQMTLLVSSHNLSELYQMATDYMIMEGGEVLRQLTLEELEEQCRKYLLIRCSEVERLVHVLETRLFTQNYKVMPDRGIKLYDYLGDKERLARVFLDNQLLITEFSSRGDTLENYYLSVVGGNTND